MHDLTAFQRDCMFILQGEQKPFGLQIKAEAEDYYPKEIHHGRLYPNLNTLVEKGLVAKGEIDDRTNSYTLSRRGQQELERRREWEDEFVGDVMDDDDVEETDGNMSNLTAFQRDCLVIVAGLEDPHGLQVKDELEDYYTGEIHHGRLYPNLNTLVEEGFVEKTSKDERTNEYHVTPEGKFMIQQRREWEEAVAEKELPDTETEVEAEA